MWFLGDVPDIKNSTVPIFNFKADRVVAAFKNDLAPYEVGKGTIRFPPSEPVPVKLIERIAKFRAKKAVKREKAKAAAPKKR